MLAEDFRITARNQSGASSDITVEFQPWKFASDGSITYGTQTTPLNAVTTSNGAYSSSSNVSNGTEKHIGATLLVSATGSGTSGVITIYYEPRDNAGTGFADNGEGIPVGSINAGKSRKPMILEP